ncbi:selenium-dependent molybdenum cofactor biosynthesis protein YqeB [Thermodesulfobacteriota bacterium]
MTTQKTEAILIKGAGEKASAVAHGLYKNGFEKLILTDTSSPLAERRGVCFCEAVFDQKKEVDGVVCEKIGPSVDAVNAIWAKKSIPLLVIPCDEVINEIKPDIIIDGIMAKKNKGTSIDQAPLVIALGPGFCAGKDAHYVIETNPNIPDLGKVIEEGFAEEHTGIPTEVLGKSLERLLTSPGTGTLHAVKDIGDAVEEGEIIGHVEEKKLFSPIPGFVWGLIRTPADVKEGQKLGDILPGNDRSLCFEITPQAKIIAEAVRNAILNGN